MAMDIETFVALGLDRDAPVEVNGRSNADIRRSLDHPGDAPYHPCPEAFPEDNVPAGKIVRHRDWSQTSIYRGTIRDLAVYLPLHFDESLPARLLVCNDGMGYLNRRGPVRAAQVLDSLHAKGLEQTVALFVNPGRPRGSAAMGEDGPQTPALAQRRFEYDALTPTYGRFLVDDLLPFVEREHGVRFSDDPDHATVCGISSGGICAFTVAWQHTERFRRVLCHCGSFTNILGGHNYPYLIRTTPRKPVRVVLQSGENDAETLFGDWPLANRTMANAFAYAGWDYRFEFGTGGHTLRHGGALFADSLRWLWRETPGEA